jgi:hypothetical protein
MTRRQSVHVAPTLVWLSVVLCALLASLVGGGAEIAVVALGAVVALFALDAPLPSRLLTAIAMVPAAIMGSSEVWMWAASGVCIGLATSLVRPAPAAAATAPQSDFQRHLEWCRRREESAHVLVVPFSSAQVPDPFQLLQCFRVTDSVALSRSTEGFELHALLDDKDFVREGLEIRLSEWCGDRKYFGWATFPQDGVTIQALLEHAKAGMARRSPEDHSDQQAPLTQPFVTRHV